VCQFVYAAIIDSARPAILTAKKSDSLKYEKSISRLYCIIIYLALAQGFFFTLFAGLIVKILYGVEYIPAVPVLQILVWYIAFSQMGRIRNIWILAEEKQKILWRINLFGALMNIAVNACLIPIWGAVGAALASLITQVFANFILGFMLKPIRHNNQLLLKGLNPRILTDLLQQQIKDKETKE
jgi:O-antigen/teichoic acid export membrane protein